MVLTTNGTPMRTSTIPGLTSSKARLLSRLTSSKEIEVTAANHRYFCNVTEKGFKLCTRRGILPHTITLCATRNSFHNMNPGLWGHQYWMRRPQVGQSENLHPIRTHERLLPRHSCMDRKHRKDLDLCTVLSNNT